MIAADELIVGLFSVFALLVLFISGWNLTKGLVWDA